MVHISDSLVPILLPVFLSSSLDRRTWRALGYTHGNVSATRSQVRDALKTAAINNNALYWDMFEVMGGEGAWLHGCNRSPRSPVQTTFTSPQLGPNKSQSCSANPFKLSGRCGKTRRLSNRWLMPLNTPIRSTGGHGTCTAQVTTSVRENPHIPGGRIRIHAAPSPTLDHHGQRPLQSIRRPDRLYISGSHCKEDGLDTKCDGCSQPGHHKRKCLGASTSLPPPRPPIHLRISVPRWRARGQPIVHTGQGPSTV